MNEPDDRGDLFRAPKGSKVEQPPQPTVDGSTEAMRRLRHPFEVEPAAAPEEQRPS
jgi:hypothetical protein